MVNALSAPTNNNNNNPHSPWKTASWQFILNIGREESSSSSSLSFFPNNNDQWGKSGARLSFPIYVEMDADRLPHAAQDPLLGGSGANRLRIVHPEKITVVTERGQQQIPFLPEGGWKMRLGRQKGHASLLRFWLDVGCSSNTSTASSDIVVQKKDVTLHANQRLYFAAHCWRQEDWEYGQTLLQPLWEAYQRAQAKLEAQVSHDTGDRRLDGVDPLETLAAYKDMAGLTLDRDDKRRQLQQAQEYLPPPRGERLPLGNWPGSTELLALQPMEVFVQKKRGKGFLSLAGGTEEYCLMGSWTAKPLNVVQVDDNDEYEYYDDDDDEEEDEDDEDEYEFEDDDVEEEEEDDDNDHDEYEYEYEGEKVVGSNITPENNSQTEADGEGNNIIGTTATSSREPKD